MLVRRPVNLEALLFSSGVLGNVIVACKHIVTVIRFMFVSVGIDLTV